MKRNRYRWVIALMVIFLTITIPGHSQHHPKNDTLFQASTISALLEGVYDGETTFKALRQSGNFGIGTFDALDGEMIGLEGKFYQVKADGVAYPVKDLMTTPFATVTFFQPEQSILLSGEAMNYEQMQQYLDRVLPTKNIPCAIRIKGFFQYLRVRSVPRQTPPYPRLNDVVKDQSIFELRNVKGTLVGFRMPRYMQGVNVAGYHFHLITQDRKGGHLLDCQLQNVRAEIDYTPEFKMVLPNSDEFRQADLGDGKPPEVDQVER